MSSSNAQVAQISCVRCSVDPLTTTFFSIRPSNDNEDRSCAHILYPVCFDKAQVVRSADLCVKCQAKSCNRACREWFVRHFNGDDVRTSALPQIILLPTEGLANKKKHPTQFFSNSGKSYHEQHAILSISTSSSVDDLPTDTYVTELNVYCSKNSGSNNKELENVGRTLHPFLVPPIDVATKSHQTFKIH